MKFCINKPIAIIDSGIGGVSVLKQLINKFGIGNYVYYADNLYMPYGNKSKSFISKRIDYLITLLKTKYNAEVVIIACNTASTSLDVSKYTNVLTMQFNKNLTYYATNLTKENLKNINVIADNNLPFLIEKYIFDIKELERWRKHHIKLHKLNEYKEIILGCTHYELATNIFQNYAKNTKFINNSSFIIDNIKVDKSNYLNIHLITSKTSKSFTELYTYFQWNATIF